MYCDTEGPSFFSERISRARLTKNCCECGKPIPAGMLYWYCAGKWDGEMCSFRQHIECRDACYTARDVMEGECIPFGGLWEFLSEYGQTWELPFNLGRRYRKPGEKGLDEEEIMRVKCKTEREVRSLFAAGKWASRLRGEKIAAYNKRHEGRKP